MTIVSNGGGQESTYFIVRCILDPSFRLKHIRGRWIVVFSDTGEEHPHTYANLKRVEVLCRANGIPFYWITPEMGYHSPTWLSLTHQYERNSSIGSAAYRQTCTDNLKVKVVDRFVEAWIKQEYALSGERKQAYYQYVAGHGKIRLILGFAKGEEKRTANGNKFDPVWKQKCVERYYPLIVDGIDRQQCMDYLDRYVDWQVWPSNCMICFYQSDQEILWLHRNYPDKFRHWQSMEMAKLLKYVGQDVKNGGVYGKLTLAQKLEKAERLYGHWTDEQLNEYKMSHGHCIKSKY